MRYFTPNYQLFTIRQVPNIDKAGMRRVTYTTRLCVYAQKVAVLVARSNRKYARGRHAIYNRHNMIFKDKEGMKNTIPSYG